MVPITLSDVIQEGPGEIQVSIWSYLLRIASSSSPQVTLLLLQLIAIAQWSTGCTARVGEKSLWLECAFRCGTCS